VEEFAVSESVNLSRTVFNGVPVISVRGGPPSEAFKQVVEQGFADANACLLRHGVTGDELQTLRKNVEEKGKLVDKAAGDPGLDGVECDRMRELTKTIHDARASLLPKGLREDDDGCWHLSWASSAVPEILKGKGITSIRYEISVGDASGAERKGIEEANLSAYALVGTPADDCGSPPQARQGEGPAVWGEFHAGVGRNGECGPWRSTFTARSSDMGYEIETSMEMSSLDYVSERGSGSLYHIDRELAALVSTAFDEAGFMGLFSDPRR